MNRQNRFGLLTAVVPMLLLAACGGSGTDRSSAVPPPSSSPTPPITPVPPPVVIFADPTPQTYALVGSSTASAGDGYTPVAPDARLTTVSLEAMNQPRLRYGPTSGYEIQLPGEEFDRLVFYKGLSNPAPDHNFFQPSRARQNAATFIITRSRLDGYVYSELASWTDATSPGYVGMVAFGVPTPAATIASTGTVSYRGYISGIVDITYFDGLYGGNYFSGVGGTVTLTVDFATRAIAGLLELDDPNGTSVITIPLTATTFLPGDATFSGLFETSQSGFNELKVVLTGPESSELIGSWAVPVMIDGEPHQLMGAWIAARL
jgi:hypothetical protein